jgi:predicted DNA-binding transcriptional regulator YafY
VPIFAHFKSAIDRIDSAFELGLGAQDDSVDKIVQFETSNSTAGQEWIYDIYYATKESYLIEFRYENIYRNEKRRHRAVPYLLKEFRNRWYMVVWSIEKEKFATYSLDRIIELQVVKEQQKKRIDFDASQFFADSVGIFAPGGKPQKVVLHLLSPFDRLVQLDPIHPSQKLLKASKEGVRIELKVHLTPELKNRILSMGPACKVEAPTVLQSEIKTLINSMKKLY